MGKKGGSKDPSGEGSKEPAKKSSVVGDGEKRGSASAAKEDAEDVSKGDAEADAGTSPEKAKRSSAASASPDSPSPKARQRLKCALDGPPKVVIEDAKLRLARTMDRFSYLNHAKLGVTNLISDQNRRVGFIVEHRSEVAPLATALRRTVSEARQLVEKKSTKQESSNVLANRLKIIDAYVAADAKRKCPVYQTAIMTEIDTVARADLKGSHSLPQYDEMIAGKSLLPGQVRPQPLMAATCGTAPRFLVPKMPQAAKPRKLMSQTI